jgi:hypothetical protein
MSILELQHEHVLPVKNSCSFRRPSGSVTDGNVAVVATNREAEPAQGEIENRRLRSALEYAVAIAAEASKRKPPMASPKVLKAYFGVDRLPTSALGRVRRAVEGDDTFRSRIAVGAIPELVDEVGRLWLQRPEGWRARIDELLAAATADERSEDAERALRKVEKRRAAAERATQRAIADLVAVESAAEAARAEADVSRSRIEALEAELSSVREELSQARIDVRHERDRKRATADKLAATEERLEAMRTMGPESAGGLSAGERDELDRLRRERADHDRTWSEVQRAISSAATMSGRLEEVLRRIVGGAMQHDDVDASSDGPPRPGPNRGRRLPLPGGLSAASVEAAEFLLRSGAQVFIDGYNVAMLAWPDRPLCDQRESLIVAAENAARRFGASLTIVFDGADVVGGFAPKRRVVRIVYSPEGVTADDVIRSEVARVDPSDPVVVVTNDAEIVRDVKAVGANVISSTTFTGLL